MNPIKYLREVVDLQGEHFVWLNHNFPNQKPHDALLGLIEEVGELSHAHLKRDQMIRGYTREKYKDEAKDAVGDIFIYLMSYCNTNGLSLASAIMGAWGEVKDRDWVKFPENGKDK